MFVFLNELELVSKIHWLRTQWQGSRTFVAPGIEQPKGFEGPGQNKCPRWYSYGSSFLLSQPALAQFFLMQVMCKYLTDDMCLMLRFGDCGWSLVNQSEIWSTRRGIVQTNYKLTKNKKHNQCNGSNPMSNLCSCTLIHALRSLFKFRGQQRVNHKGVADQSSK